VKVSNFFFYLYLTRQDSYEQILIYNDSLHQPNLDDTGPIVHHPMGLPITAGCDSLDLNQVVCSDTSSAEMQCLRPLHHLGVEEVLLHLLMGSLVTLRGRGRKCDIEGCRSYD
jgi:hypothetical protein